MNTKLVKAADLLSGQQVLANEDLPGFTVSAVTQAQGRVQVTDQAGRIHAFTADKELLVK